MITPELIGYIRGEFSKGRTREELSTELIKNGGWNDSDLNEAFRVVIPVQNFTPPTVPPIIPPTLPPTSTPKIFPTTEKIYPTIEKISPTMAKIYPTMAMPAQNTATIAMDATGTVKVKAKSSKRALETLVLVIVGIACGLSWYFYRPQITNFFSSGVKNSEQISANSWNFLTSAFDNIHMPSFSFKFPSFDFGKIFGSNTAPKQDSIVATPPVPAVKEPVFVKDCGTTISPDLKQSGSYQDNEVLKCLGYSALQCENAKAVLQDALFPTIFKIVQNKNADQGCNFELSYASDSALSDVTGKKLALQYISCPLSIVKAVDETTKVPSFSAPSTDNLGKYASQIYFYGTLGLFMENNVDKSIIQSLGCSGTYIDSVVASYQKMQVKK